MSGRVLIVEDEQLVAADLESKLQRLGLEVIACVASGSEAISLAVKEDPDLILMDIRLQGSMDGIEAAQRLRGRIKAKVIFVSAFGQLARLTGGRPLGEICLTKPFSNSQLKEALTLALGA